MWPATAKRGATDVAPLGEGFLIVGATREPSAGRAWISSDGLKWSRLEDDPAFEGAGMTHVAAFGDGVVALGPKGRRLFAWASADGTAWQRVTIDRVGEGLSPVPWALTDGPAGLLAVVSLTGQDVAEQRFYRSSDGLEWSSSPTPLADDGGGLFVALESTADEYVAVARPAFGEAASLYWRSPDGVEWTPFDGPADAWIHDIAVGDEGGLVAVGAIREGEETIRPAIWHATELGRWEVAYTYPSAKETEDSLDLVEAGGPGFVATGTISSCPQQPRRYCPTAAVLVSEDGREWRMLGTADGVPGPLNETSAMAMAANGPAMIMLVGHVGRPSEAWTLLGADRPTG
jgi:hypothetical protein